MNNVAIGRNDLYKKKFALLTLVVFSVVGGATIAVFGNEVGMLILGMLIALNVVFLIFKYTKNSLAFFLGFFIIIQQILVFKGLQFARYLDEVLILVFAGVVLLKNRGLVSQRDSNNTPIDKYVVLFLLSFLVSGFINRVPLEISMRGIYSILKGILMFYIVWSIRPSIGEVERFFSYIIKVCYAISVINILQFIFGLQRFNSIIGLAGFSSAFTVGGKLGFSSIFRHPGNAAYFLVLFFPIVFVYFINKKLKIYSVILIAVGLILTNTIGALLAIALSVFWLLSKVHSAKGIITAIAVFGFVGLLISLLVVASPSLRTSSSNKFGAALVGLNKYMFGGTSYSIVGTSYRVTAIFEGVRVWKDHILLGVGPGRYGGWVAYEYGSPIYEQYRIQHLGTTNLAQSDNFWLRLLVESGVLGFILFIFILRTLYNNSNHIHKCNSGHYLKYLSISFSMSLVALVISGLFLQAFESPLISYYFWAMAGVILSLGNASTSIPRKYPAMKSRPVTKSKLLYAQ